MGLRHVSVPRQKANVITYASRRRAMSSTSLVVRLGQREMDLQIKRNTCGNSIVFYLWSIATCHTWQFFHMTIHDLLGITNNTIPFHTSFSDKLQSSPKILQYTKRFCPTLVKDEHYVLEDSVEIFLSSVRTGFFFSFKRPSGFRKGVFFFQAPGTI